MVRGKRGQNKTVMGVVSVFIGLLVLMIGFKFLANDDISFAGFGNAVTEGADAFYGILKPLFNFLLNLDKVPGDYGFLALASFIMIFIVILATMDATGLFGNAGQAKFINFIIGLIVAIIGVRYMPPTLWSSLTQPSSALVPTILVGLPFAVLAFMTAKIDSSLVRRLVWLLYASWLGWLVAETEFIPYVIFLVLAIIMMAFDGTIRNAWHKIRARDAIVKAINTNVAPLERYKLRKEIKANYKIMADSDATDAERQAAKDRIKQLEDLYGDLQLI